MQVPVIPLIENLLV